MRIIVDADATPSINLITEVASSYNLELILYVDHSHNINNDYATIIYLTPGFQSVDTKISNDLKENDILITQDYGLAVIGLSKKSHVINPKGTIYTNDNMDIMLFERYLNTKNRKMNNHIKGPKKRTKEDDINLYNSIQNIIEGFK